MNLLSAFAESSRPIRVMSFGGGVQSVTIAALQYLEEIEPYDVFLFCNVGDDSEEQATLDYFRNVFQPWAVTRGINAIEIQKTKRDGTPAPTLYQNLIGDNRSIGIPIYMSGGAPGNRTCTTDWKIRVVNKWIKQQGYTHATIGIGFSCDESDRAKPDRQSWYDEEKLSPKEIDNGLGQSLLWPDTSEPKKASKPRKLGFQSKQEYPLLTAGIYRDQCKAILDRVGLPLPPKSACWFCPFSSKSRWIDRKRNNPELFERACGLEKRINQKRGSLGLDTVTLHPGRQPLAIAIPDQPLLVDFETGGGCNTGYCFT